MKRKKKAGAEPKKKAKKPKEPEPPPKTILSEVQEFVWVVDLARLVVEYAEYTEEQKQKMCKTRAMDTFLLSGEEIMALPHRVATNPHGRRGPAMILVRIFDAEQKAVEKYGSLQALATAHEEVEKAAEKRRARRKELRTERRERLKTALAERGLDFNSDDSDSEECSAFIRGDRKRSLASVVNLVEEQKFFDEQTNYRYLDHLDWRDGEDKEEKAKTEALKVFMQTHTVEDLPPIVRRRLKQENKTNL